MLNSFVWLGATEFYSAQNIFIIADSWNNVVQLTVSGGKTEYSGKIIHFSR